MLIDLSNTFSFSFGQISPRLKKHLFTDTKPSFDFKCIHFVSNVNDKAYYIWAPSLVKLFSISFYQRFTNNFSKSFNLILLQKASLSQLAKLMNPKRFDSFIDYLV